MAALRLRRKGDVLKRIPLSQGEFALVDDADFAALSAHKWHVIVLEKAGLKYAATHVNGRRVYMHRMLVKPPRTLKVDHADGDGLNNQRANLRTCTHRQNIRNNKRKPGASGFRGVTQANGRWVARFRHYDKNLYLGRFDTPEGAARAYDATAIRLCGEFARPNFT